MANKATKAGIRNNKISFYLADSEKEMIDKFAVLERLQLSALIRKTILDAAAKKEKKNE